MTISSQVRTAGPYAGTGSVSTFPFAFKVFQASDLQVARTNPDGSQDNLTLSSDFTAALNADQNANPGGSVTLAEPLDTGYVLNISSSIEPLQNTALTNQGGFFPKVIENALDRQIILSQQQEVQRGRALRAPDFVGVTPLPVATLRAGKALVFDADGNPQVSADNYNDQVANVTTIKNQAEAARDASATSAAQSEASRQGSLAIANQFGDVQGAINAATVQAGLSAGSATSSANSASVSATNAGTAISAAGIAQALANRWPDTAAGVANTADGRYFSTPAAVYGDGDLIWQRVGATAVPSGQGPGINDVKNGESARAVMRLQPNLMTFGELAFTDVSRVVSTLKPIAVVVGGLPAGRLTVPAGTGTTPIDYELPRSLFGDATVWAAHVVIAAVSPHSNTGSGAAARVLFRQYAGSSELTGLRVTNTVATGAGLAAPATVRTPNGGIAFDPTATKVRVTVDLSATSSSIDRTLDFRELMVAAGSNSSMREPPTVPASRVEALAGVEQEKYMTPAQQAAARREIDEMSRGLISSQPNAFTEGEMDGIDVSRVRGGSVGTFTAFGDIPCYSIAAAVGAGAQSQSWNIPRLAISGDKLCGGLLALYATPTVEGGVATIADILIQQYAGATEITGARVTVVICGLEGVLVPKGVEFATTIDPTCDQIVFRVRIAAAPTGATNRTLYFTNLMMAGGVIPYFRRPPAIGYGKSEVWMATAANGGADGNKGTEASPVLLPNRAADLMRGVGDLVIKPGEYDGLKLDQSKVRDMSIIGITDSTGARPLLRYGTKATNITKTAGQTKVYQFAITLAEGAPNWIWQDGVADLTTLIPADERHELTRQRTYRLPCVRTPKATATTLAAAMTELDAASTPLCFYDSANAILYFTIQGGGDGTAASMYVSSGVGDFNRGLISNAPLFWAGGRNRLLMSGFDSRYGNINLRPFRRWGCSDMSVLGAPENGYDIAWEGYVRDCEGMGSGSGAATNGDALCAHNIAEFEHQRSWLHDNFDDGESTHEKPSHVWGRDGVAEYNRGNGLIPALGARAFYERMVTRKNALTSTKYGGIAAINADTIARAFDCISYDERYAFMDQAVTGTSTGRLDLTRCVAVRSTVVGFQTSTADDCRIRAMVSGIARHASTVVTTSASLT